MRGFAAAAAIAATLALGAPGAARAETRDLDKDLDTCSDLKSTPPDEIIAACGRVLRNPEVAYGWRKSTVATLHGSRAYAYFLKKDYRAAVDEFGAALRLDPKYDFAILFRGRSNADMGNHAAAVGDYTQCLRVKPDHEVCYLFRGMSYIHLRNYAAALRDLNAAIRIKPTNASAHGHRGLVHEALGQRQAAIRDYRAAIRLGIDGDAVQKRLAALESGAAPPVAPAQAGDPEQYRQACHEPPNPQAGILACTRRIQAGGGANSKEQSDTFNSRAWWRYKAGQYQLGLADADRAIALDPGSAPAYDTRGHIYRALGRRDAAIGDFRQALALNPNAGTRRSAQEGLRALGVSVSDPPGTPVDLTWRFRNNSGGTVHVKMYARQRGIWWPTASTNWRMDGVGPYAFTISCRAGEKVCYGAWRSGNTDRYWGTGFQDRNGCDGCCYTCFEGQTTVYNLNP